MARDFAWRPIVSLILMPLLLPLALARWAFAPDGVLPTGVPGDLLGLLPSLERLGRDVADLLAYGARLTGLASLDRDRMGHAALLGDGSPADSQVKHFVGRGLVHDHWTAGGFLGADGAALRI